MGFGWNGNVSGRLIKHTEMYGYRLLIIGVAVALETGVVSATMPGHPFPRDGQPRQLKPWERNLTCRLPG